MFKSLIVAVLSTLLPFIFVNFFTGCISQVGGFDGCGYLRTINITWSIFVFIISFIASLIAFGLGDK